MAYQSWSVVFGEQPSASKWNILGSNDASFNDGTGIGDAVITPDKLATGATGSSVATSQGTTSDTYTDLATTQTFDVTVGANGLLLVGLSASMVQSALNCYAFMSFTLSGANTLAAASSHAVMFQAYANNTEAKPGGAFLLTALNAGVTTVTAKFRRNTAGTATFSSRSIWAIPL